VGFLRFRRRFRVAPGVTFNLGKKTASMSFGVRGAHYTVGTRGTRSTVGIPGTGLSYTLYSRQHARHAVSHVRSPKSASVPAGPQSNAPKVEREPMMPITKIVWGVVIFVVGIVTISFGIGIIGVVAGAILGIVGWVQHGQPQWQIRGLIRKSRSDPAQAIVYLEQARKIDPGNAEALAASAELHFVKGDWTDAAAYYEQYLTKAPNDWKAEAHEAVSYLNSGRPDDAVPHLQRLRALPLLTDESHTSITNVLALAFLEKADAGQALELVKTLPLQRHNLDQPLQHSLFLRAIARYGQGAKADAIKDLDRLYALNADFRSLQQVKAEMQAGTFAFHHVDVEAI